MTPELVALGRRAVACKAWRWVAGMLMMPDGFPKERWLLCWVESGRGNAGAYQTSGGKWWGIAESEADLDLSEWIPDLSDTATIGCLLALVREAWGDPHASVGYCDGYDSVEWAVTSPRVVIRREIDSTGPKGWMIAMIGDGDTEAEALVAALEAAP